MISLRRAKKVKKGGWSSFKQRILSTLKLKYLELKFGVKVSTCEVSTFEVESLKITIYKALLGFPCMPLCKSIYIYFFPLINLAFSI